MVKGIVSLKTFLLPCIFIANGCRRRLFLLIHLPDEVQDLIPAHFLYGTGNEMLRQELPGGAHAGEKGFYIGADSSLVLLISLCEDKGKRDLPLSEPVDEFQIDLLRGMTAVDKHEDMSQVFPLPQIVFDHLLPFLSLRLGHFGEPITREVDHIPCVVDIEMIDELRLTGRA